MSEKPDPNDKYQKLANLFKSIEALSLAEKLDVIKEFSAARLDMILFQLVLQMTPFERNELIESLDKVNASDNREHDRKDCVLLTDYVVGDRLHKNYVKDISEGGVFIEAKGEFTVGDKIVQSLSMFDEQILFKFNGEIVRIDNEGVGVKFTNLTPYQLDTLKRVMNKLK